MKKKLGRPSKLTPELQAQIILALRAGNYIEVAAAHVGIDKVTLYAWLREGARHPGRHREFSHAVLKAQAEAHVMDVARIAKAAQTQWQAAAWRLERKFPAQWGRRDYLTHEHTLTVKQAWGLMEQLLAATLPHLPTPAARAQVRETFARLVRQQVPAQLPERAAS